MARRRTLSTKALLEHLRTLALGYPEASEHHPWGETAIKVRGKVFLFLHADDERTGFSVKLPHSRELALSFDATRPTEYGLGKSGWVSVTITHDLEIPLEHIEAWVDESYRAIAPKKLVAQLTSG